MVGIVRSIVTCSAENNRREQSVQRNRSKHAADDHGWVPTPTPIDRFQLYLPLADPRCNTGLLLMPDPPSRVNCQEKISKLSHRLN